jgi:MFS family permease
MAFLGELGQYRQFVRLLVSRLFGSSASQMLLVAVGWQMYEITGSAWDLGLVGLVQFTPVLLFTLIAGHAADRLHRAKIVASAVSLQCAAALLLLVTTLAGSLSRELLFCVSLLIGTAQTFQRPAQQSLVPSLVPIAALPRATALSSAFFQVSVIGGPAVAGLLFAFGGAVVYAVSLAFLLVALGLVLGVDYVRDESGDRSLSWDSVLAGARFVFAHRMLLGAVSLDLLAVLFGGATALLPIYARDILMVGATGLGVLRSAPAVGALLMSVMLARFPIRTRVGRWLLLSVAVYGCCMLLFGISTSFVLSLLALAVSGAADMVSVVVRQTLIQLETPDAMRGRVGAVSSVFIGASNQLGEFESGATAAWWGPVASVVVGGVATVGVVAAWWRLFPQLVARDRFTRE